MTRILFLITLSIFLSGNSFSQKIKMKKGTIYLDGEEFLTYEKRSSAMEFVVFELNSENELFTAIFYNGDKETRDDNIYRLIFTNSEKKMEYSRPYWNRSLISWLMEQKVLTAEGKINEEKIDIFIKKFDENLTERTFRGSRP